MELKDRIAAVRKAAGLTQEQLGELLGLPTVNAVSSIELDDGVAHVERTVGAVVERLDVPLPAVRRHHRRAVRKAPCVGRLCAVGKGAGGGTDRRL